MFLAGTVALYVLLIIAISLVKSRKVQTQDDFMVAGRRVSTLFLVSTLICTWIGSGSLFGGAGRAFREGFSALWMSAGAWAGLVIVYFLAPKVRLIEQYTVPDVLEKRYNLWARLLGSIAVIIAYLTIASYQFDGAARLLNILIGLDPLYGKLIACSLVVLFTIAAGMMSIVAMDIVNGSLIIVGVFVALPIVYQLAGGWSHISAALPPSHFSVVGKPGLIPALGLFLPTFFLLLGESSMYQKFFSARDERAARRAVVGMILGVIFVETALAALAIFGASLYAENPAFRHEDGSLNPAMTETVIIKLAADALPPAAGIILLWAVVAIIFSTANTFLMIPSTNLARDIYQRLVNPTAAPQAIIRFQRVTIIFMAAIAFVVSSFFETILDMALYAYTMVGAAVTPALLAAFLWRRVTVAGGVASIGVGMAATGVFGILNASGWTRLDYDYVIYPAAAASLVTLVCVSLLTPPSPPEKWRPFWADGVAPHGSSADIQACH